MKTFEAELGRIPDVLAVRSVQGEEERHKVHVLASPGRSPDEIAGDVESLAVLRGIELEPEGVHVVQLQAFAAEPQPAGPAPHVAAPVQPAPTRPNRIEIDGVLVLSGDDSSRAVITVRRGEAVATGTSVFVPVGAAVRRGVAEAALCAVLNLLGARNEVAVDNALVLPLPPHQVAVVTLAAMQSSGDDTLVGAVLVRAAGVNDALARAVLDATNRWVDRHGTSRE